MFSPFSNCPHEREEYFTQQFEQELKNTNKPKETTMTQDKHLVKSLTKKIEKVTQHHNAESVIDALAIVMNQTLDELSKKESKTKMSFIRNLIRGQK
jgi:phage terminase small subunit